MLDKNTVNFDQFISILDEVYDEIFIWDKDRRIVYANNTTYRHYGIAPEKFIGKTLEECTEAEQLWTPTSVFHVFEEKKPGIQRQKTKFGEEIITISVPIFNDKNEVEYIVQSVRDSEKALFKTLSPLKTTIDENFNTKIIYQSNEMKEVIEQCKKVAKTDAPVLILGETGTGKSLLARNLHSISKRKDKPFINVNIASISPSVIESEFFGYEKGAFTGALAQGKKGFFQAAEGGTLFLDEIGELSVDLQAKFLHALQEGEIIPVGSHKPIPVDVRIVCATNCDLTELVEAKKFRKDLYHRLNIFEVTIPPLRKRPDDIMVLSAYFLNLANERHGKSLSFSKQVLERFSNYTWDGNTRELSNVIERGVITAEGNYITSQDLPESFFNIGNIITTKEEVTIDELGYEKLIENYEMKIIKEAYKKHKSTRKIAAALKISQTKASRLVRKYCE